MAYRSFGKFIEALAQAGELKRVALPVDTDLLIAAWADREMKSPGGGKALLFEQPIVDGAKSEFPVAINTMGSRRRIAMALGRESVDEIAQEIQLILKAKPPTDLREGFALLKQGIHLLHARPKTVKDAACQEVVHRFAEHPTSNVQHPTTNERRRCIGRCTKSARGTANVITRATNGCRSQLRLAAILHSRLLPRRRCRTVWMKFCSRDFCGANRSKWRNAKRSTLKFRPMSILF